MLSLGELAVAMPVTGSFHTYATKFISPGTGFTVAWLYWICWTVALGTEFLGAAMLMQRWFPSVPAWMFAAFFALVIFGINALSVRSFAEAESFFSSVVLASLLPMKEAGVSSAPFVDVFDKMGIPFAADIMNFVILTAILSAGNSTLRFKPYALVFGQ